MGRRAKTLFLPNALVTGPWEPFDDDDVRSLIGNCCIKGVKQQRELGDPSQKMARTVRVHGAFTLLMFVLATASQLQCEGHALGDESVSC